MPTSTLDRPRRAAALTPASARPPTRDWNHHNADLLQRTRTLIDEAPGDRRYWTAYDYFMLEREGRALRRAYLGGLISAAWTRLRAGLATRKAGGPR